MAMKSTQVARELMKAADQYADQKVGDQQWPKHEWTSPLARKKLGAALRAALNAAYTAGRMSML